MSITPGPHPTRIATAQRSQLPGVVYALAAGAFLMGTAEFVLAGLLPELATDLGISIPHAGLLITSYALGMIIGPPATVIVTLRLPRRTTLICTLFLFTVGHVVLAFSANFTVLLVARFIIAVAAGAFWAVATVVGVEAADTGSGTRAVGVILSGGMLATVLGVPLGAFAGQLFGWRSPFWALAVLAAAAAIAFVRLIPQETPKTAAPSLRAEVDALRSLRVWLALSACAAIIGSIIAAYTYVAPLLTDHAGLPSRFVPLILVGFGCGAVVGSAIGGRLGDKWPYVTTGISTAATAAVLLGLGVWSANPVMAVGLVCALGLFGFVADPVFSALAIQFAEAAPMLVSALTTSLFNIGSAIGTSLAGLALTSSWGLTGPPKVGGAIAVLLLLPIVALAVIERRTRMASGLPSSEPRHGSAPEHEVCEPDCRPC